MDYATLNAYAPYPPQPSATLHAPTYLTGGPVPLCGSVELIRLGSPRTGAGRTDQHSSDEDDSEADEQLMDAGGEGGQPRKNPFAPECSVPLPFQIGDEYGYYGPSAIWKRNERERHRVRCVNDAYDRLRLHLPVVYASNIKDRRLSKVDTLRLAIRYIGHLQNLLVDAVHDAKCTCYLGFTLTTETRPIKRRRKNAKPPNKKRALTEQ